MLLRARRNDDVEEELTREARRGLGELLLERWSPGGGRTGRNKQLRIYKIEATACCIQQTGVFLLYYPLILCLSTDWCLVDEDCSLSCWARC